MSKLEKIMQDIEQYEGEMEKEGIPCLCPSWVEEIIKKNLSDNAYNTKCSECSRRKFYQEGYKDGKKNNGGWIPVEERLPQKEYATVLCITNKNHYFVGVFNNKFGFRTGDIDTEGDVIAWRPLPEPYRKGGE